MSSCHSAFCRAHSSIRIKDSSRFSRLSFSIAGGPSPYIHSHCHCPSVLYLVTVYRGSAIALQKFLRIDDATAVITILGVVTIDILAGGLRSAFITAAVQRLLIVAGALVLICLLIDPPSVGTIGFIPPRMISVSA